MRELVSADGSMFKLNENGLKTDQIAGSLINRCEHPENNHLKLL